MKLPKPILLKPDQESPVEGLAEALAARYPTYQVSTY